MLLSALLVSAARVNINMFMVNVSLITYATHQMCNVLPAQV